MNATMIPYSTGPAFTASNDEKNIQYNSIPEEITNTNRYPPTSRNDGQSSDIPECYLVDQVYVLLLRFCQEKAKETG